MRIWKEKKEMRKIISVLLSLCMLVSLAGLSAAEETAVSREDRLSETRLTATIQGQEIEYTATAGTLAQFRRDAEACYGAR